MTLVDVWGSAGMIAGHLLYLVALLGLSVWLGVRGLQRRLVV